MVWVKEANLRGLEGPKGDSLVPTQEQIQAELDPIISTTASVDELSHTVFLPCWTGGDMVVSPSQAPTMWVAPFPLYIVAATLLWDYSSQTAQNDNYLRFMIRCRAPGGITTIVQKTTELNGGEAIQSRVPWDFANSSWNNTMFNTGDLLSLQWNCYGGAAVQFPVNFSFRYVPA